MGALVLFGASGDLACRMLLPSLYALDREGLLPDDFRIIGCARGDMGSDGFRDLAGRAISRFCEMGGDEQVRNFLDRLTYVAVDAANPRTFSGIADALGSGPAGDVGVFLSTPPSLFAPSIEGLKMAGLAGGNARVVIEKPVGHDLGSSHQINDAVGGVFPEDRTYRIDHYLGKETVQNLLVLRFANVLFEPLWNADNIDHFQITVAETVGLEGRGDFYDGAGALRDMVQNHMLQLLALVAMEPPSSFEAAAVRNEKVKVLKALRPMNAASVARHSVIGQYAAGSVAGQAVPGYADDLGAASDTETFVALKAHVDNWRWKGVPFYLRTGKRLPLRRSEIVVQFKAVPHSIFGDGMLAANKLVIRLQPEESIRLMVMVKEPGIDRQSARLREMPLDLSLTEAFAVGRQRLAYERLLLDFINADQTLFVRRDEVEAQWAWIDALRAGWHDAGMTPAPYAAGSWGPDGTAALIDKQGVNWHE
ncbi:MAG: glucose-6-phosphate dehydrogenase [Sphingomonadales bacterium]